MHTSVTEEADEQVKEEFYVVLHDVLDNRNIKGLLIITGDINAKVGGNWRGTSLLSVVGKMYAGLLSIG